jgi:histidyl-tRNA synthetase
MPIKWFSIPQCWRYERMQKGRGREHFQWNVDIWGTTAISADAELFSVITTFLEGVGLTEEDVVIRVSSRKVLEEVLGSLGIEGDIFAETCIIVDKMDKLSPEVINEQLAGLGHGPEVISTIQSTLGLKHLNSLKKVLKPESKALQELTELFEAIDSYGISDWVEFDGSIVRGLAYYTGSVFEVNDRKGKFRAICGGGRYDKLLSTLGGKDLPATGFGFGDMVIMELLKDKGLLPQLLSGVEDVVIALEPELKNVAVKVASVLRDSDRLVDLVLENKKMKWAFKHAERVGANRIILVATEEWSRQKIKVKDLQSGEEFETTLEEI